MSDIVSFSKIEFHRFKAFKSFKIDLKDFNILVGPNNAGKSTILTAFRILASSIRRANSRKATIVPSPDGHSQGHHVDLEGISVADENIFHNYDNSEDAYVKFYLSNGNSLLLFFPTEGGCSLIPHSTGRTALTPAAFRTLFNCPIGFVPILGPVEHREELYAPEAARLALYNYRAARNFRNIWYHFSEDFDEFRQTLSDTWPGMDIKPPERSIDPPKTYLYMFCTEDRIHREIFWSGFGFQVWCQMLTHLIKNKDAAIFLIDEPDIYLHSSIQRQLVGLLRSLGPSILIATLSTEIISEAETDEIVIVNKEGRTSSRLRNPEQLVRVFEALGSNTNPVLTQLARTRRALFLEGKDFRLLGRFARKLGATSVANSKDFAVVAANGFNPERIRNMTEGIEATLGFKISSAVVLDRDFRSDEECETTIAECLKHSQFVSIHRRKEVENFLLVPSTIERAARRRLGKDTTRCGNVPALSAGIVQALGSFAEEKKSYLFSQMVESYKSFARKAGPQRDPTEVTAAAFVRFEELWGDPETRLALLPGKEALSAINRYLQDNHGVSVSPSSVIEAMHVGEVFQEMRELVETLEKFSRNPPRA